MRDGNRITTAQVSVEEFQRIFEEYLKQDMDIVYIGCSSKQSGSVNTGFVTAKKLMEKYEGSTIICIDSLNASMGEGMLAIEAAKLANDGASATEIEAHILSIRKKVNQYVTVHSLDALRRAGRVKGSAAFFGNLMGVKPIIIADANGDQAAYRKVKGRQKSFEEIVAMLKASIIEPEKQTIYLTHAACAKEEIDGLLYLDPDIIVNGSLLELYEMPLGENYFAAASHNGKIMRLINGLRLGLKEGTPYINSGVLLINLELLRREQNYEDVFEYIKEKKKKLFLPDQDVISGLYGKKIVKLDTYIYNMTDRLYRYDRSLGKHRNFEWYREHSVVFHYCGKNKPWKEDYSGVFGVFYKETLARMGLVCESERITANA